MALTGEVRTPILFFYLKYYTADIFLFFRWITPFALLAAACFPNNKFTVRLSLFLYVHLGAIANVTTVPENGFRPSIWLAFCLLFMPWNDGQSVYKRTMFNLHYWFSLIMFSFAYSAAGIWKILWGGVYQLFEGRLGLWDPQAMAYIIAEYCLRTIKTFPIGEWFIENYFLGWVLLIGASFAEATIWIVFLRPSLWRVYGVLMVVMHTTSKMTLNIGFEQQYILTGLIFLNSPFEVKDSLKRTFLELPAVKFVSSRSFFKKF
jgi:hypothetical protein